MDDNRISKDDNTFKYDDKEISRDDKSFSIYIFSYLAEQFYLLK